MMTDSEYEAMQNLAEAHTQAKARIAELERENARLRQDSQRFEWYFSPHTLRPSDFFVTYHQGVMQGWTVDQWRAAIDEAMKEPKA